MRARPYKKRLSGCYWPGTLVLASSIVLEPEHLYPRIWTSTHKHLSHQRLQTLATIVHDAEQNLGSSPLTAAHLEAIERELEPYLRIIEKRFAGHFGHLSRETAIRILEGSAGFCICARL